MSQWKMHTLKNGRKFTTWKITKNTLPEYVRHFSSVNEVVCQNLISCIKVLVYTYPDTMSLASLIALFPIWLILFMCLLWLSLFLLLWWNSYKALIDLCICSRMYQPHRYGDYVLCLEDLAHGLNCSKLQFNLYVPHICL